MSEPSSLPPKHRWALPAAGILIGLLLAAASGLSGRLAAHRAVEPFSVIAFVLLMTAAGVLYAAAARHCRSSTGDSVRIGVLAAAVGLRLTMAFGTPILEDDPYRYLWDGALVAHFLDPYAHAPANVPRGEGRGDGAALSRLAGEAGDLLERINHPWLRTIYPPVAQVAFGIAHGIGPWRLWAWRLVLAAGDLAALAVLFRMGAPPLALLIYGWNPLLIKEVYNSGHVDGLLPVFLLAAVVAVHRNRPATATLALGVAAGIKLWPAMLMPLVWWRLRVRAGRLAPSVLLGAAFLAAILLPMVHGWSRTSGLAAYGRYWEMNDALYLVVARVADGAAGLLGLPPGWALLAPRAAAAGLVAAGVAWLARRRDLAVERQFLMAATLLFLLSPTQFPWYFLWILPFLALAPHPALVFYTALLPLYYLRPLMEHSGRTETFDDVLVWVQHGPVIVWLFRDWCWPGRPSGGGWELQEGNRPVRHTGR